MGLTAKLFSTVHKFWKGLEKGTLPSSLRASFYGAPTVLQGLQSPLPETSQVRLLVKQTASLVVYCSLPPGLGSSLTFSPKSPIDSI